MALRNDGLMEASFCEGSQQLACEGALNLRLFHIVGIQLKRYPTSTLGVRLGRTDDGSTAADGGAVTAVIAGISVRTVERRPEEVAHAGLYG